MNCVIPKSRVFTSATRDLACRTQTQFGLSYKQTQISSTTLARRVKKAELPDDAVFSYARMHTPQLAFLLFRLRTAGRRNDSVHPQIHSHLTVMVEGM